MCVCVFFFVTNKRATKTHTQCNSIINFSYTLDLLLLQFYISHVVKYHKKWYPFVFFLLLLLLGFLVHFWCCIHFCCCCILLYILYIYVFVSVTLTHTYFHSHKHTHTLYNDFMLENEEKQSTCVESASFFVTIFCQFLTVVANFSRIFTRNLLE